MQSHPDARSLGPSRPRMLKLLLLQHVKSQRQAFITIYNLDLHIIHITHINIYIYIYNNYQYI